MCQSFFVIFVDSPGKSAALDLEKDPGPNCSLGAQTRPIFYVDARIRGLQVDFMFISSTKLPEAVCKTPAGALKTGPPIVKTGQPIEVRRKGRSLRIVPEPPVARMANLRRRPTIKGNAGDLAHADWSGEWNP